jgi:Spy/CpxP family protein refolding chaperone
MKIANIIVVAAALALASAPAFAHGGGMGGMGGMGHGGMGGMDHGNGMSSNTKTNTASTNNTKINKTGTTKTVSLARAIADANRINREIMRLIKLGKGNSKLVKKLTLERNHLQKIAFMNAR